MEKREGSGLLISLQFFSFLLRDANKGQGILHVVFDRLVNKCLPESVVKFSDPFHDLLSMLLFKVFLI